MPPFTVTRIRTLAALRPLTAAWSALAGDVPFRAPEWLMPWWEYYGEPHPGRRPRRELCVLVVERAGEVVGIAPWFIDRSPLWGNILKQLGTGEVCSDYQTLLVAPDCMEEVAAAVADFLSMEMRNEWDRLDLDGCTIDDAALAALVEELQSRGAPLERRRGPACWKVALPATYDEYLATLSKSHRKQLRRLERNVLDTPRARWHTVRTADEFALAWPIFVELHQRRRKSLGDVGCFVSSCFEAFHEEMARTFLARGALRLQWLELDGTPLAAEYHLLAGDTLYGYQSGIDPDRLEEEPGRLAGIAVIRQAIDEGLACYDLLRGDEPYKAHWRAVPTPTDQLTLVNPRRRSRARHKVHQFLRRIKYGLLGFAPRRENYLAPGEPPGAIDVATPETCATSA
ncbi:MAG: hypothetical protein C0483_15305 [Pirellula sp.]|nr:hypothetical protein [Pirellula sp.]